MSVDSYQVIITLRAASNGRRIRSYTAKNWGVYQAEKWHADLVHTLRMLEQFPERHPIAPENIHTTLPIRHVLHPPFRILFRIVENRVEILHIRHSARLPIAKD